MKHHNLEHETIINSDFIAQGNPKHGEIATFKNKVQNLYFHCFDGGNNYKRVYLTRDMIMDLSKQIEEIETEEKQQEYFDYPF